MGTGRMDVRLVHNSGGEDPRVLVCGWVGSTNLGDELVFAGIRRLLGPRVRILAVSVDPAGTRVTHRVAAIDHRRIDRIAAAAGQADLVVFGGGGLVQDETSPLNLPYHLSRPWLARLRGTPVVGIGLGVGRLRTAVGRQLARSLGGFAAVSVRDGPSQQLLAALGVDAHLSADAALHLARDTNPHVEVEDSSRAVLTAPPADRLVVALRPWTGGGGLLPVAWRRGRSATPDGFVPLIAAQLDRVAEETGLTMRFVALQRDRDHLLHQQVAARMRTPAELLAPDLDGLLAELAGGRAVIAMRYHAGVGATIAGRPSVLIGYSPKVDALAATLGTGSRLLAHDPGALAGLADTVIDLLEHEDAPSAVAAGRRELLVRASTDVALLDRFLR